VRKSIGLVALSLTLAVMARQVEAQSSGSSSSSSSTMMTTVTTPLTDKSTLLSSFKFKDMFPSAGGISNSNNRGYSVFPTSQVAVGTTDYLKQFGYSRPLAGKNKSWWEHCWPWGSSH
jgi:hypothetical protein